MTNTSNYTTRLMGQEKAQIAHRILSNPKIRLINISATEVAGFFQITKSALSQLLSKYPMLPSQPKSVKLTPKSAATDFGWEGKEKSDNRKDRKEQSAI
jgi:hypothetical protein